MKTNGRPAKGSKPFVPGGTPLAPKGKSTQGARSRNRSSQRPLYQYDNPDFSELDWLDDSAAEAGATEGGVRKMKLHGYASPSYAEPEEPQVLEGTTDNATDFRRDPDPQPKFNSKPEEAAAPAPAGDTSVKATGGEAGDEISFSSALSVRPPGTVRLLPLQLPTEGFSSEGSLASDLETAYGAGVQHGTIPFAFRDRSRIDIIIPLETPFKDSGYSLACSLDVPYCHAVVRAKLTAEAVVTLIRTQEEGNARGRLDWIAAGSLQEGTGS